MSANSLMTDVRPLPMLLRGETKPAHPAEICEPKQDWLVKQFPGAFARATNKALL
jgi:hypothetical protein